MKNFNDLHSLSVDTIHTLLKGELCHIVDFKKYHIGNISFDMDIYYEEDDDGNRIEGTEHTPVIATLVDNKTEETIEYELEWHFSVGSFHYVSKLE